MTTGRLDGPWKGRALSERVAPREYPPKKPPRAVDVIPDTPETRIRNSIVLLCDDRLSPAQEPDVAAVALAPSPTPPDVRSRDEAIAEDVSKLAGSLRSELTNASLRAAVVSAIVDCAKALPTKQPLYSCLSGLLNEFSPETGAAICESVRSSLQSSLSDTASGLTTKLLVRFVSGLVDSGVLVPTSISRILELFVAAAAGEGLRSRSDFFANLAVLAMPWAGPVMSSRDAEGLKRIVSGLESVMDARRDAVPPSCAALSARLDSVPREDGLTRAWSAVHSAGEEAAAATSSWPHSGTILRPALHFSVRFDATTKHDLGVVAIPEHTPSSRYYAPPAAPFVLFGEFEPLPRPIDRLILEDLFVDTVHLFFRNPADAAKHLLCVPALPSRPVAMHVLVETLFGQMFALPAPSLRPIFYQAVMSHLLKAHKPFVPHVELLPPSPVSARGSPSLTQMISAMRGIIQNVGALDVECVDRFIDSFSWHLSNFDFLWAWPEM